MPQICPSSIALRHFHFALQAIHMYDYLTVLAGVRCRQISSKTYSDGRGSNASIHYPHWGYQTLDSKYILFIDTDSCARSLELSTGTLKTIIGKCVYVLLGASSKSHKRICMPNWEAKF